MPERECNQCGKRFDAPLTGQHRLLCGDARDSGDVERLFAGARANVVITSPPYASQRKYDESSEFRPVPPDQYVGWFQAAAVNIAAVLAAGGSFFLNIKEHADDGERDLYVMDLVIAHRRQWGWRLVDTFCWRKTDNGVPGGWENRFKNAWEPVFHFCRQKSIKFRPKAVGHVSDDCFVYSPGNPRSNSGSGLLGSGARGAAAGKSDAASNDGYHEGVALPSNVIEVKSETTQGLHSAPFPRALVEFFIKAFSDRGDIVWDPFMGSGTSMSTAHVWDRIGYGCEISPAYCDVIVQRMMSLGAGNATLEATGQTFHQVALERGVREPAEAIA